MEGGVKTSVSRHLHSFYHYVHPCQNQNPEHHPHHDAIICQTDVFL